MRDPDYVISQLQNLRIPEVKFLASLLRKLIRKMTHVIAFDLDGTSVEREGVILPELIVCLSKAFTKGIMIGIVSGRRLEDQLRILSTNGLGPSIGFPHFLIANEYEIHILKDSGYEPLKEHNEDIRKGWLKVLPIAKEIMTSELSRLTRAGTSVRRNITDEDASKRCMIDLWFEDVQDAVEEEMFLVSSVLDGTIPLTCNRNHGLVQLLHARAGKGNTLKAVAGYFKIAPSDVLAIGDSSNDLSMLDGKLGFRSAAVANADEDVKRIVMSSGGYIASKPRGAGVIEIIDNLVFNEGDGRSESYRECN